MTSTKMARMMKKEDEMMTRTRIRKTTRETRVKTRTNMIRGEGGEGEIY